MSSWVRIGVSGVSGFDGWVRVPGASLFICGGGGFGLFLHRPRLVPVLLGLLVGGEEEGPGHLVKGGAARILDPNGTIFPPVDTTDGALLYPCRVGYVDDCPDDRIVRRSSFFSAPFGVSFLVGGGLRSGGGSVGLGAESAFVGRMLCCGGGGGLGLFATADRRVVALQAGLEGELFFGTFFEPLFGGGWVAARPGGGGVGAVVMGAPPAPPRRSPHPLPWSHTIPHPPPPTYPTSCFRAYSLSRK